MPTNASAGLVNAFKASLADTADKWSVTSVIDASMSSTGYNLTSSESGYGLDSSTSATDVRTVTLESAALAAYAGGVTGLKVVYQSIWLNDSYSEGRVIYEGATFKTTDSALDTTVRAKAATFLTSRDSQLTAALGASAASADYVPSNVLAALKASLADAGSDWQVRSVLKVPTGTTIDVGVTMVSMPKRIPAGTSLPAQLNYTARLAGNATLLEGRLYISGAYWRVNDTELHTTLMAAAAAFTTTQQAAIVEGLEG